MLWLPEIAIIARRRPKCPRAVGVAPCCGMTKHRLHARSAPVEE